MKKYLNYGIALSMCLLPGLAMAAVFVPQTGDFSVPANWNSASVPGAGEFAEVYGKECIVTTTESVNTILTAAAGVVTGTYVISVGGDLTATGQALIGHGGLGSLLVDGGNISVGREFAVGELSDGSLTINSGSINSALLLGVGWGGNTGSFLINGGTVVLNAMSLGSFGGNSTCTIHSGSLTMTNNLNGALEGYTSVMNVEGGIVSAGVLNFATTNNWGTQTVNLNGGQIITSSITHLTQALGTTFNIGFGELVFTEASVEDANILIDSGAATWNFLGIRSVATNFAGGAIITSLPIPPTGAPTILSSSLVGNVMKVVVDAPGLSEVYYPVASSDLVGGWGNIPHSDDGVNPFVVTNLGYSTTDTTGTNEVIYLETDQVNKFFKIMGE